MGRARAPFLRPFGALGIDDGHRRARFFSGPLATGKVKRMVDALQRAIPIPQIEIVVGRAFRDKVLGQRVPLAAGREHVKDRVQHFAHINAALAAAALGRRNERLNQRPLRIRQITRITQAAPVCRTAMFGLPHRAPIASGLALDNESQPILSTQQLFGTALSLAYAGELETGAAHIERALALNPNSAAAWRASGWVRIFLGEPADAIESFERAIRLSPLDPFIYQVYGGFGAAHFVAGRYDEAASWARKASQEQPNSAGSWRVAATAYGLSDRIVEAREAMARLRELSPALRLSNLARVAPPLRRPEDLARWTEGLRKAGLPE